MKVEYTQYSSVHTLIQQQQRPAAAAAGTLLLLYNSTWNSALRCFAWPYSIQMGDAFEGTRYACIMSFSGCAV